MIITGTLGFIVDIVVFFIILLLLYALSMVWPPDSPWAPWWQMPKETIRRMYTLIGLKKKDIVYELGCGLADAMVIANREFDAKAIGIEIDPLRVLLAQRNVTKHHAQVTLIKENFFDVKLSDATVVIVYLVPKALGRLSPKLFRELKKGTRIISYRYAFPKEVSQKKLQLIKHEKKNEIYYYKII